MLTHSPLQTPRPGGYEFKKQHRMSRAFATCLTSFRCPPSTSAAGCKLVPVLSSILNVPSPLHQFWTRVLGPKQQVVQTTVGGGG